ncbi:MAG: hypothetical protein JRN20_08785 [Nitrososphaerota archaeon]|nr:hypothetical protein [Nitrososphaerota archaeon]MDG6921875.1 hypothetical protein [Nitrososphaerota archaeon]
MSRAEEITSEVRRLVLTCRAMEAQLQQSVPKKTHQEAVSKMQNTIDGLNAENERIKDEYQKSAAMNETVNSLANLVKSQGETVASLSSSITNQNLIIEGQKTAVEALNSRLSQTMVPTTLYDQSQSELHELQEKVRDMVSKSEYASLQKRCDDLAETMKSMVPREDYIILQNQFANFVPRESFEALQKTLSQYVPRDQLVSSETRVRELEARLENYVPLSDYEELTAKIALLAKEASTLSVEMVPAVQPPAPVEQTQESTITADILVETSQVVESITPIAQPSIVEQTPHSLVAPDIPGQSIAESETETNSSPAPAAIPEVTEQITQATPVETTQAVTVEATPEPPSEQAMAETPVVNETPQLETPTTTNGEVPAVQETAVEPTVAEVAKDPAEGIDSEGPAQVDISQENNIARAEVTEIQAELSEIKSAQDVGATAIEMKTLDSSLGFVFANTVFCAKSGLEFLQDLEQTPIETIQNHMKCGDFERWFKEALSDDTSAESLKSIRENNIAGEELRTKIVAVIAPRYKS